MNRPKKPTSAAPSFEMSDEPFPELGARERDAAESPAENAVFTARAPGEGQVIGEAEDMGNPLSALPKTGPMAREDRVPVSPAEQTIDHVPDHVSYESRIQILEAWRYRGSFTGAPGWIDRNWLSHGDYDPLRNIEPGPALRIPLDSGVVIARLGDYVCQQSVALAEGVNDIRLEVWPAETFQKLFIPKQVEQHKTYYADFDPRAKGITSSQPKIEQPEAPAIVSA